MLEAAKRGGRAVVIGGGLLGLEAAAGLKMQGMDVTVLHLMPTLMERQLDPAAGFLLEEEFKSRGIDVLTKANSHEIVDDGTGKVAAIRLDDGTEIDASIIVMAVGIRPSADLAKSVGLEVNRGVLVGDDMRTSDADIFALGECVEHRGMCYGLVAPLYEMAEVIADNLLEGSSEYTGSVTATKLKVTGVDLYSAGDFAEATTERNRPARRLRRRLQATGIEGKQDHRCGSLRETADGPWFFDMLKKETDVSEMRETLIFGQAYQGVPPWTLRRPLQPCRMMLKSAAATAFAREPSFPRSRTRI